MKIKKIYFLALLAIIVSDIRCEKFDNSESRNSTYLWQNEIFSAKGDIFRMWKVSGDTTFFRFLEKSPSINSFLDSGSMYIHLDTVFMKIWKAKEYSPFLILNSKNGETTRLSQPYFTRIEDFMGNKFVDQGTLNAKIVKRKSFQINEEKIHVFDIYRSTKASNFCRLVYSKSKCVIGIWFLYDGRNEFEGLDISEDGLGWHPGGLLLSNKELK